MLNFTDAYPQLLTFKQVTLEAALKGKAGVSSRFNGASSNITCFAANFISALKFYINPL